jgi:tRNA-Thr(GGU) m(6)t(6)A37 methyltransferase TsaA
VTDTLTLTPIGVVRSPFTDRWCAPRQPGVDGPSAEGRIVLARGRGFEQAVRDLDGIARIWVITWFHRNEGWKPMVLPPRGPRVKRGVFATRSPHRPNPLGLSLLPLRRVQGLTLHVGELDLLDGTPVFDVKPYLPYAEAFPDARAGWIDAMVAAERAPGFTVACDPEVTAQLDWLREVHGVELLAHAAAVLRRDPTEHPYRRIQREGDRGVIAVRSWRLRFGVAGSAVTVDGVESGYSPDALAAGGALEDAAAHRDFHARVSGATLRRLRP